MNPGKDTCANKADAPRAPEGGEDVKQTASPETLQDGRRKPTAPRDCSPRASRGLNRAGEAQGQQSGKETSAESSRDQNRVQNRLEHSEHESPLERLTGV